MKCFLFILAISYMLFSPGGAQGQTAAADNVISKSITFSEVPKGSVYGIFEGRPPCQEIARQLGKSVSADCTHLKWRLFLFRDSVTLKPTTYRLVDNLLQKPPREGKWTTIRGTKAYPQTQILVLEYDRPENSIFIMQGDENVLFILDQNKEFRTGNLDFSYTLNRVELVRK